MWDDIKQLLSVSHSEQEDAEGVCGGPLDISGTPEIVDRLSQGASMSQCLKSLKSNVDLIKCFHDSILKSFSNHTDLGSEVEPWLRNVS